MLLDCQKLVWHRFEIAGIVNQSATLVKVAGAARLMAPCLKEPCLKRSFFRASSNVPTRMAVGVRRVRHTQSWRMG